VSPGSLAGRGARVSPGTLAGVLEASASSEKGCGRTSTSYARELHDLAMGTGRPKFEALKLALLYICGPPVAPVEDGADELRNLSLDELKARVRETLKRLEP